MLLSHFQLDKLPTFLWCCSDIDAGASSVRNSRTHAGLTCYGNYGNVAKDIVTFFNCSGDTVCDRLCLLVTLRWLAGAFVGKESCSLPSVGHSRSGCAHCTETIFCTLGGTRPTLNFRNLRCLIEGRYTLIKHQRCCVTHEGSSSNISEGQVRAP